MAESGGARSAIDDAMASASSTAPAGSNPPSKKWVSAVTSRVSTKWIGGVAPGVPAQLVLTWAIPAADFDDGDEIRASLPTATEYTGEFFVYGEYWDDEETGARATLPLEDVGAGVDE